MSILNLRSLSKDFGIKIILKNANFGLNYGEKVGIIGTNGSGKSTLLKMIAGLEPIDRGEILLNQGSKVIYLPQQPEINPDYTVLEQLFAYSKEKITLIKQYEQISAQLTHTANQELLARLTEVSQKIEATGAWELETNAKITLNRLGIEDFTTPVGSLSGGYRKRIALASALLSEPDLLLMDEPTNHLDAASVEWLQSYLNRYRGSLLLITHDRYFLDQVTDRILEIDQGELYSYAGNYSYYLQKKAEAEESIASSQSKHAGRLRRELVWLSRGPKARSTKQRARIERIEEMAAQTFKTKQGKVEIATASRRIGKKVIELNQVTKTWGDRLIVKDFSYIFNPDDRIGIIGNNGVGKSTLMDLITGRTNPDQGKIEIGTTIKIGYFDQHSDNLIKNPDQRVIEYLKEVAELVKTKDGSVITASQMLERFLFAPDLQYAPIHKLSGGEKRRLFLLEVLISSPNVLILDEPTNDLDIQTLSVLEEYLEEFPGCVIVVSHDRYFLDRTVNTILAFESEGTLRQYPGNYSLYLDQRPEKVLEETPKTPKPVATVATPPPNKSSKLSYKEKQEYYRIEQEIPKLEAEKREIEQLLYCSNTEDFARLHQLTERLAQVSILIDQYTEKWLELAEKI